MVLALQVQAVDCMCFFFFFLFSLYKKAGECLCVPQYHNVGAEITVLEKGAGNSRDYRIAFLSSKIDYVTSFSVRVCESQL